MDSTSEVIRLCAGGVLVVIGLYAALQSLRSILARRRAQIAPGLPAAATPTFLFDGGVLVDASATGAALIADAPADMPEREALFAVLARQFPDLRRQCDDLQPDETRTLESAADASLCLTLSDRQGLTRISLTARGSRPDAQQVDDIERTSLVNELNLLRQILRGTPQMIWAEDDKGQLTWANSAYLSYADRLMPDDGRAGRIWPGQRLFSDIQPPLPGDPRTFGGRHALQLPGEKAEHWFDITAVPQDGGVHYFAIDANATVRAERAKKEFQQTLAKTFADLSIGLAFFNHKRKLAMFNPALMEMTGLPFAYLSAEPSIDAMLDRLREMRKLPEPKNYASWKDQFTALEAAAKTGTYAERWEVPDGQTFRVTGRPHPDGALAFVFEDITAEVSLTRRFRAEIEMGQSVMNALPDAIAVFSPSNTLLLTNAAYDQIWQKQDAPQMIVHDLRGALRIWKSRTAPSALWREVEGFGRLRRDQPVIADHVVMTNGRSLSCEVRAIAGGMTMVRFSQATDRIEAPLRSPLPLRDSRTAAG